MHLDRWEGPVQNPLSSPSAPLISFILSLWPLCVLPDWPSWFNDLAQTGHSDRTGEKESEWEPKAKTSRVGFIAAYRSEFSHFSLRFIFYFLHLFVLSPVALVSLYLQFIPLSFSDTAIHFSLPLKIPVPSSAFISDDHSSLPLSSSVLVFRVDLKGVTDMPSEKVWQRSQQILYQTETLVRAHKHTSAEHSSFFCYFNKANVTKVLMMSFWCIKWHSVLTNSSSIS